MPYRDDLEALRNRHAELTKELDALRREQRRLEDVRAKAALLEDELAELNKTLEATQKRRSLPLLDDVKVASPCSESWDEMVGDERVRFCLKCDKNVYNVGAMTRDEAEALIARAEGGDQGLCLRLYRRKDGTVLTSDCPVGRRRRRVTRVAAAALAFGGGALAIAAFDSACTMGEVAVAPPRTTADAVDPIEPVSPVEPIEEPIEEVMGDVVERPVMGRMTRPVDLEPGDAEPR
ncbi:MAG TPA: hypothetical protein ENK57_23520 [Polyangiaceae bacterium]|nr:hypothetical protein [Polyangiaceae bacterium]